MIISVREKEQVEQHVEEEVVHEVVSPDQSWRHDESDLIVQFEHDGGDVDGSRGKVESADDPPDTGTMAEGEDSSLDDPFRDDAGVFCLDTEEEVQRKIATYEKKSGTHFIVLKKEKGYTQTGKEIFT